jgi:hypothetical protein
MADVADKLKCKNCKFWSQTVSRVIGNGGLEALCENPQKPTQDYTKEYEICNLFEKKEN